MVQTTTQLTPAMKHQRLLVNYRKVISALIKTYFLKNDTTEEDIDYYSNQALSLIDDLSVVQKATRGISEANKNRIGEYITLLTIFESSLVVTRKNYPQQLAPRISGNIMMLYAKAC